MKRIYFLLLSFMLGGTLCFGANRYWVGPSGGTWNNSANWAVTLAGSGGASVPGPADAAIFNTSTLVNLDVSPTVLSLTVDFGHNVTLYTSTACVLTILNILNVDLGGELKDSTSADVPFTVLFNGTTHAAGNIQGQWIFAGRVPVTAGGGAAFTAQPGSKVTVSNISVNLTDFDPAGPAIICRNNTGFITSDPSTLVFSYNAAYILENNQDAAIPNATWANDSIAGPEYGGNIGASASTIFVSGNMAQLKHLAATPVYGNVMLDLPALSADASFALPDGSRIRSNFTISHTNNHTLTLLANTSASSNVSVTVGSQHYYTGSLFITGTTTKVALATSNSGSPAIRYRLALHNDFSQTGGTFSMQGNPDSPDSATLAITLGLVQIGGTFIATNNLAGTNAPYVIEMNGPLFIDHPYGTTTQGQVILMKGMTVPSNGIKTTLRLAQSLTNQANPLNPGVNLNTGVTLLTPVQAGRLELIKGTLNTSDSTALTVTNTSAASAVVTGGTGESYVVGPLKRNTSSTDAYFFPVGMGASLTSPSNTYYHPCSVIPVSVVAGTYQATYFNTAYSDLSVAYPLKGVSNKEYWDISKISGANASVLLTLNAAVPGAGVADSIVVAHYVDSNWISERGTAISPGTATSGSVMSKALSSFSQFTLGYADAKEDSIVTYGCPKDTTVIANALTCKAKVIWRAPSALFPDTIGISGGANLKNAKLTLKGIFNGHGYYDSDDEYYWPDARAVANKAGGHLVSITTQAESSFIYDNINEQFGYCWIGMYNTGTVGVFAWVTGEPVNFTNWIPGEPNNLYNDPRDTYVFEPYVHINGWDSLSRWNDIGSNVRARFMAEFDTTLLTYRQISGPNNGDSLKAGMYTVCYEKTNAATGVKDTCCFNITVTCNATTSNANALPTNSEHNGQPVFTATAFSNPSRTSFSVKIVSDDITGKTDVQVTDVSGRVVERRNNLMPGSMVQFGNGYLPGIYFARITQGSRMVTIKLVKQ